MRYTFFLEGNKNCRVGTKTGSVGLAETQVSFRPKFVPFSYNFIGVVLLGSIRSTIQKKSGSVLYKKRITKRCFMT